LFVMPKTVCVLLCAQIVSYATLFKNYRDPLLIIHYCSNARSDDRAHISRKSNCITALYYYDRFRNQRRARKLRR